MPRRSRTVPDVSSLPRKVEPVLVAALRLLLDAFETADRQGRSVWECPVKRRRLVRAGLTVERLRWLLDEEVVLQRLDDFVLTERAADWARLVVHGLKDAAAGKGAEDPAARPRWDAAKRELTYGGRLVKRYLRPAGNQGLILDAFEEEGWPEAIDDPLPGVPGVVRRERLHDTVRRLNGSQQEARIRFERAGGGKKVGWRMIE